MPSLHSSSDPSPAYGPAMLLGFYISPVPRNGDNGDDDDKAGLPQWQLLDETGAQLTTGSRRHCEKFRLGKLLQRHGRGNMNIPTGTIGGKQFWSDEWAHAGWRIQRNTFTGHCRLLDDEGRRRAWGSFAACLTILEEQRLEQDLRWPSDHLVVLLHGIFRAPHSLHKLEQQLQQQGLATLSLTYPSTQEDVSSAAHSLNRVLAHLEGIRSIDFVTHSMGSLVVRESLSGEDAAWREGLELRRLVFIFPPSQGSDLAEELHDWPLYRWLTGPAGQDLRPQEVAQMPLPDRPTLVVAGSKNAGLGTFAGIDSNSDGTVTVQEAQLPGAEFRVFPVGHTFGMNDPQVIQAVLKWLLDDERDSTEE